MDGFMASAATGAMSSLLAKLAELLGEDYKMQRGMRREIAFLKDELSSMNALLERLADTETLDPQTKEWRDQVREMSYDIEDCVDDYMRQLQNEPQRYSGITGFFFGYVQKVKDLVTRHEIAEQIQELKARIVEAGHRRKRYKIDDTVNFGGVNVIPVDRRLPALYAELGGLVGISVPRDEVIKLVDDGVQGVKVVSIVGCGGLGKTTVANQVYKNIAEKFDCQAFVSLSQNPDMVIVFQSILSQVMKDECGSTSSCDKELLITELRNFLKDKSNPTKGSTVAWPHRPLACTRLHTLFLDHVPTSTPFRRSAIQGITCPSYAAELLSSTASAAGCPYTGLAPCATTIAVAALHRRSRRCQGPRRDRCRPSLIAFIFTWLQSGRPVDCRGCRLPCTDEEAWFVSDEDQEVRTDKYNRS